MALFRCPGLNTHTHGQKSWATVPRLHPGSSQAAPWLHPGCSLVSRDTSKPRRCRCGSLGRSTRCRCGSLGCTLAAPWRCPGGALAVPVRCQGTTFRPALAMPWRCRCGAEDGGLRFRTTSGRGHPDRPPYLPDRFRVISGPPLLLSFIIKDLPGPSLIYKKNHHRNQPCI